MIMSQIPGTIGSKSLLGNLAGGLVGPAVQGADQVVGQVQQDAAVDLAAAVRAANDLLDRLNGVALLDASGHVVFSLRVPARVAD